MARQYHLNIAACTSIFFALACSATIFSQTNATRTVAARGSTRDRGRPTLTRKVSQTSLASLDGPTAFSPVVIYYSRDGAEVADVRAAKTETRNEGIGESITIYYGGHKSSGPLPVKAVPKPRNTQLANNSAKQSPQKSQPPRTDSANTVASAAPGVDTSRVAAASPPPVDPGSTTSTATSAPAESRPNISNDKPADSRSPDVKPPVEMPVENPSTNSLSVGTAGAAYTDVAESKPFPPPPPPATGTAPPIATAVPETKPATEIATGTRAASETIPPPPAPNPSAAIPKSAAENSSEAKPAAETSAPAPVMSTAAETKPASETTAEDMAATLPSSSTNAVDLNNEAVQLARRYRFDEASVLLRKAIQAKPDTYELHRNLSIVYERMNKMNDALASAMAAVKLAPAEPSAVVQLCNVQLQSNSYDAARLCYEDLSKLTPLDPVAETSYGVALLRMGKTRDALAILEKAAARAPANIQTLNALGVAYFNDKRYADSIVVFKKGVELDPYQHGLRFNLAIAYISSGNKEDALSQYKMLKEQDAKLAGQLYRVMFRDKVISVDELRRR